MLSGMVSNSSASSCLDDHNGGDGRWEGGDDMECLPKTEILTTDTDHGLRSRCGGECL